MPDLGAQGKGGLSTRGQVGAVCDFNGLCEGVKVLFINAHAAKAIALALGSGAIAWFVNAELPKLGLGATGGLG